MARLIDADNYKPELLMGQEYLDEDTLLTAINVLDCQPTVDAVEVVRCRDCKWYVSRVCRHGFGLNYCKDDDFCSYGERRDTDGQTSENA